MDNDLIFSIVLVFVLAVACGIISFFSFKEKGFLFNNAYIEASKYEKRSHFKAGSIGAYTKSRINGWLDVFFPHSNKNK